MKYRGSTASEKPTPTPATRFHPAVSASMCIGLLLVFRWHRAHIQNLAGQELDRPYLALQPLHILGLRFEATFRTISTPLVCGRVHQGRAHCACPRFTTASVTTCATWAASRAASAVRIASDSYLLARCSHSSQRVCVTALIASLPASASMCARAIAVMISSFAASYSKCDFSTDAINSACDLSVRSSRTSATLPSAPNSTLIDPHSATP